MTHLIDRRIKQLEYLAKPRLPPRPSRVLINVLSELTLEVNSVPTSIPKTYWLCIFKEVEEKYDTMSDIDICGIPGMESCIVENLKVICKKNKYKCLDSK